MTTKKSDPMRLAFAISVILALQGYSLFTAPNSAYRAAVEQAKESQDHSES